MPPVMTVGSRSAALSRSAMSDVVVVLPCVPVMDTVAQGRISSASISARRMIGMPRSLAASNSGLPRFTAVEMTSVDAPLDIRRVVADQAADVAGAQAIEIGAVLQVAALHGVAAGMHHLGDGAHADAADADDMHEAGLLRIGHVHALTLLLGLHELVHEIGEPFHGVDRGHGMRLFAASARRSGEDSRPCSSSGQALGGKLRLAHAPAAANLVAAVLHFQADRCQGRGAAAPAGRAARLRSAPPRSRRRRGR